MKNVLNVFWKRFYQFTRKRAKLSWSDTYLLCFVSVCLHVPWCLPGCNRTRPSPHQSGSRRSSDVPEWSGTTRCRPWCDGSLDSPGYQQPLPSWQSTTATQPPLPSWSKNPQIDESTIPTFCKKLPHQDFSTKWNPKASGLHFDDQVQYREMHLQTSHPHVSRQASTKTNAATSQSHCNKATKEMTPENRAIKHCALFPFHMVALQTWLHWMIH